MQEGFEEPVILIDDLEQSEWEQSGVILVPPLSALEELEVDPAAVPAAGDEEERVGADGAEGAASLVWDLALANLLSDWRKLAASLVGVVFAATLMIVQVGLLLGFVDTTTALIARSPGDVWLVSRGTRNFEMVDPQRGSSYYQALATPGVRWGGRLIAGWSDWQTPAGERERVFVVGVDPERPVGLPWAMAEGELDDLFAGDAVVVDALDRDKLGGGQPLQLGQPIELMGHRSRLVGLSREVRSFTTFPYVFTNLRHARDVVVGLQDPARDVHYVVLGLEPDADRAQVQRELEARLPDAEALSRDEFVARTACYWLVSTGVGAMNVLASLLGLLVGGAIVAQTTYARTMERLHEYGTLKALGASDRELGAVVLVQALITGACGFVIALLLAAGIAEGVNRGRLLILLEPGCLLVLGGLTLAMCAGAAGLSVRGVVRLEPAIAFRA